MRRALARAPRVPAAALAVGVATFALAVLASATAVAAPPAITAPAALVIETTTGQAVFSRNPDQPRPMASTTKLMTVLLTLERASLGDVLTAPRYHAGPAESKIGLRPGERMTVADLLRASLLPSANDAAATLAVGIAGSRRAFVQEMNARAVQLGLTETHYSTPVGLDQPGNHSSPRDLARLVLRLRRWRFFRSVVDRPRAVLRTGDHRRTVVNRNVLVREVPWVSGVKTGHTIGAGYVLVGSATRGGVTVISVVMGDPSESTRDADSLRLLRYGLDRFRLARPLVRGRPVAHAAIHYRRGKQVSIVPVRSVRFVARRGRRVTVRLDAPSRVDGPLDKGAVVGHAVVRYGGRRMAEVQLVTAEAVPAAGVGQRLVDYFTRPFTFALVLVLLACVLPLALLRARAVRRRRRRRSEMETGTA